jgi:DnaJ-class molecular chaperone
MPRDYYAVLGLAATAGPREIRQAYRQLARRYSPDVNVVEREARALFDEIVEAYRILSDPTARSMYDRLGAAGVLEVGRRGDDVHAGVELSFGDAARGIGLDLDVPRFSPCGACRATGNAEGRGCPACRGRGVRRVIDVVRVDIPAGVDSGTEIRLRGEGSAAPFGGPRGDLVVSTRVREHPFFKRQGDAVHCEVPISLWEALRGGRIRIPTPTHEATLVVPPGTAGGQAFRLRGQGVPKLLDGTAGDLFVTIRVVVPSGLDARTDELVRELERLLPLMPRADLDRFVGGGE